MRTFTKLFAIIAALVTVSCTTGVTEELGIQLGSGEGQTVISLSLEESRTQLGEKADNLYPLYWSEGDKISVNGVESSEAQINASNAANASFAVAASAPYCIAYPAAPAGQVLFADKQTHVSNTSFGSGVSTMYAYSENTVGAQLNHLTGVLKIGVTGSAKLALAQISTIDRAPIAGAFDFDFEKGEIIKASASAKEVIEYSFGEGVQLSGEPTYIHVAVPAGIYNELYVTLYDVDGGVMYAIVNAGTEKPLTVGNVREFSSSIDYFATESVFVVKDVASLKAFAEAAATLTKDVLFVNDVDMTGEAWTPIEGFVNTVRGNGYAIKGLTAPLFGTTSASIKGLHLRNVNINETVTPNVGAFARRITATETISPIVEHCSVSGNITVNCADYIYKEISNYHEFTSGGLVGSSFGVSFDNCVNNANINIVQLASASLALPIQPGVGGLVGGLSYYTRSNESHAVGYMTNCTNNGDLTIANNGDNGKIQLNVGGCVGIQFRYNFAAFENIVNRGNITLDAAFSAQTVNVAGVVAYCYTNSATNLYNYGNITWNSGYIHAARISGVICYMPVENTYGSYASHLYNYGDIKVNGGIKINNKFLVSGCVSEQEECTQAKVSNCENNGNITVGADMNDIDAGFRIGGIMAYSACETENIVNNGDITISSRLYNAESTAYYICVGGCVAYKSRKSIEGGKNTGNITFSGKLDTKSGASATVKAASRLNLGGILGYGNGVAGSNLNNEGAITLDGITIAGQLRMGGLVGQGMTTITNSSNSGDIEIKGKSEVGDQLILGGIGGYIRGATKSSNSGNITIGSGVKLNNEARVGGCTGSMQTNPIDDCTNSGNITINGTYTTVSKFAGIAAGTDQPVKNSTNTGNITVNGTFSAPIYLAGIVANPLNAVTDGTNKGAITLDATINATTSCGVGGVLGYAQDEKTGVHKNLTNEGTITVKGTSSYTIYTGGVIGNVNMSNGHTNIQNKESGVITVAMNDDSTGNAFVGGAIGLAQDSTTDVVNHAPISISGGFGGLKVGGVVAAENNYNRTNHNSYGDITISAKTTGGLWVGGFCAGGEYGQTWTGCNYADINITSETSVGMGLFVGGLYGKCDSSVSYLEFKDCANEGNITVSSKSGLNTSGTYELRIGGLAGTLRPETSSDLTKITNGFVNKGNITYNGSHIGPVMIGGIIGEMAYYDATKITGTLVNLGDITCTGSFSTEGYVGGIAGSTSVSFANAQVHCLLKARNYTGYGMVTGSARSESIITSNCAVGGYVSLYDSADMNERLVELSQDNYFNYIYGSGDTTDWTGTDNYDGNILLATKPEI